MKWLTWWSAHHILVRHGFHSGSGHTLKVIPCLCQIKATHTQTLNSKVVRHGLKSKHVIQHCHVTKHFLHDCANIYSEDLLQHWNLFYKLSFAPLSVNFHYCTLKYTGRLWNHNETGIRSYPTVCPIWRSKSSTLGNWMKATSWKWHRI